MKRISGSFFAGLFGVCFSAAAGWADPPNPKSIPVNHLKIVASVFSDAQLWTDRKILGGYRMQQRNGSQMCRLLGLKEEVLARGTRENCEARLKRIAEKERLKPAEGEVVVLLHGLFQTRASMETLERFLSSSGEFRTINFGYASTRADIDAHATALREVLADLPETAHVSFVGHSMGCIIVRRMFSIWPTQRWKLGRCVMIAPPSQGSVLARRFSRYNAVCALLGPGFKQLAQPKEDFVQAFPPPPCEFAIFAGESPQWMLNSPLVDGDDDWIVGVAETSLAGAKVEKCVHAHHGNIVHDPEVLEGTYAFLKRGKISSPASEGTEVKR